MLYNVCKKEKRKSQKATKRVWKTQEVIYCEKKIKREEKG